MRTGDRTVYKVAQKWEECPGQSGSSWRAEMRVCARGRRRKACPVYQFSNGMQLPLAGQPESASRNFAGFRVKLSQTGPKRKACPALDQDSGTQFPQGPYKRKGPLCRGPSQFKVAGKGIAPALRACGPLRRSRALRAALANAIAFTQLRALTGFDSTWGPHKRKGPLCRGPSQFKVAGKGIEPLTRGFSVLCSTN